MPRAVAASRPNDIARVRVASLRRPVVLAAVALAVAGPATVAGPLATARPLGAAATGQPPGAEDWPLVGGDPAHTGTSPGGARPPYRRAWTAEVAGGPVAGPVAAGGQVVVVGDRSVVALDAVTGDVRWEASRSGGPAGPAAVAGDLVIHGSGEGFAASVVGRALADGRERWRFRTGAAALGGLTADGDRVYVGTRAGEVVALRLTDGDAAWRFRTSGRVETAPAVAEGRVVVVAENFRSGEASVVALEAETGRRAWTFSPEGPSVGASSAAIAGGEVFVGLGDGQVHALDLRTGAERWAVPVLATSFSARAFTAEAVPAAPGDLVISDLAHVYRLDPATGNDRWSFRINELLVRGSPAISDGAVIVGDDDGGLSAISLEDGVRVWRARFGAAPIGSVAVASDRVFAAGLAPDGRVFALETDPAGTLMREVSESELSLPRAVLNFIAAAAAVGAAVFGLFRFVLRLPVAGPAEGEG